MVSVVSRNLFIVVSLEFALDADVALGGRATAEVVAVAAVERVRGLVEQRAEELGVAEQGVVAGAAAEVFDVRAELVGFACAAVVNGAHAVLEDGVHRRGAVGVGDEIVLTRAAREPVGALATLE